MNFTQQDLGKLVSRVFFRIDNSPFVVPIQGNFKNPQDYYDGDVPRTWLTRNQIFNPDGRIPDTWIGYRKKDSRPRTLQSYGYGPNGEYFSRVYKIAACTLQIVGNQAEDWAESVAHWMLRGDVQDLLVSMDASLLADELGRIEISTFVQDGLNSVLAYNVSFNVEFASTIDVDQPLITGAEITGTVTVQE